MDNKLIVGLVVAILIAAGIVLAVVTTGGHGVITEAKYVGDTVTEVYKIAFNANIGYDKNNEPKGKVNIKFHELDNHLLDEGNFRASVIRDINYDNDPLCPIPRLAPFNVVTFKAIGSLNNEYGWTAYITLTDFEEPAGEMDGVRIILEYPTAEKFDTAQPGYFTSDHVFKGCDITNITKIDSGNVQIRMR